jgi:hypothetical protein
VVPEETVELFDRRDHLDGNAASGTTAPFRRARGRCARRRAHGHVADVPADHVGDGIETVQPTEPWAHEDDVFGAAATQHLNPPSRIALEPRFAIDHEALFWRHGHPSPTATVPLCPAQQANEEGTWEYGGW